MWFLRLLALFTVVPLVELALLLYVGSRIGPLPTFLLVLVTGIVGAALARREGTRQWRKVQATLQAGRIPARELVDALLIVVAGAVLITPGVLTDIAGLLLLIPPVRGAVVDRLRRRFAARVHVRTGTVTLDADQVEVRGEEPYRPPPDGQDPT